MSWLPLCLVVLCSIHAVSSFSCPPPAGAPGSYCTQNVNTTASNVIYVGPSTSLTSMAKVIYDPNSADIIVADPDLSTSKVYIRRVSSTTGQLASTESSIRRSCSIALDARSSPSTLYVSGITTPSGFNPTFYFAKFDLSTNTFHDMPLTLNGTAVVLYGLAFGAGTLYGATSNSIVRINVDTGIVSLVAGSPSDAPGFQDGMGSNAMFSFGTTVYSPNDVGVSVSMAVNNNGVFVVDSLNNCIRLISLSGTVTSPVCNSNIDSLTQPSLPSSDPISMTLTGSTNKFSSLFVDDSDMIWMWQANSKQLVSITVRPNDYIPFGSAALITPPFQMLTLDVVVSLAFDVANRIMFSVGTNRVQSFPITTSSGLCLAGSYCPPGSVWQFGRGLCTAGYFCPAGSTAATGAGACGAGFASITGSSQCSACIQGFYSSAQASNRCNICSERTYAPSLASTSCSKCPKGHTCFAGAFKPINSYEFNKSVTTPPPIYDPFKIELDDRSALYNRILWWIVGVDCCIVACIVIFAIISHKFSNMRIWCLYQHECLCNWLRLDVLFARAHWRPNNSSVLSRKTFLGGFFSIACIISVSLLGMLLFYQYYYFPQVTSNVVSGMSPWQPHGTFRLTVTAHGNGLGSCVGNNSLSTEYLKLYSPTMQSMPFSTAKLFMLSRNVFMGLVTVPYQSTIASGQFTPLSEDFVVDAGGTYRSYNTAIDNGTCKMVWECTKCRFVQPQTDISVFSAGWSFANFLDFEFEGPGFTSSSHDTTEGRPFSTQVHRVYPALNGRGGPGQSAGLYFYNGDLNFVKIFGSASTIPISLTPYFVVNGSETVVGFQPSVGVSSTNLGSSLSNTSQLYWPIQPLSDNSFRGFLVNFRLTFNPFSIEKSMVVPSSQTFLVLLASQSTSLFSLFVMLFSLTQFAFNLYPGAPGGYEHVDRSDATDQHDSMSESVFANRSNSVHLDELQYQPPVRPASVKLSEPLL